MDFPDLESAYNHLEERALDYKYSHQIAAIFQKLCDKMQTEQNTKDEKKAQWEINIFFFSVTENNIQPRYRQPNEKGKEIKYPTYDLFDDSAYDYVIKRLNFTKHPILKAIYVHFLWCSPKKHGKYAQVAIDAYLKLVKLYEEKDKLKPQEHFGLKVIDAVKSAFFISLYSNDNENIERAKSEIIRLIFNFNPESSSLFALLINLIDLMLNQKNTFSKDDFLGVSEMCSKFAESLENSHQAISIFKLGEKIDEKLETTYQNWKKSIAERYEKMMEETKETNKSIAIEFCQDALKYYRQLNDINKIRELEKTYDELKDKIKFKKFEMKLNLKKHISNCQKIADDVAKRSSEEIYFLLMTNKSLLPKSKEMETLAEKFLKEHSVRRILPTALFDQRGHKVEHVSSKEEIKYYYTLDKYRFHLETQFIPLIHAIMMKTAREEKISFASLMNFFDQHSWFGKTLRKKIQNEEVSYSWMNLLAPSLLEYFKQMEFFRASQMYPNLVLTVDSLVLKIEGLIRDLCNFSGITTFVQKEDNQRRKIYQEKDLNALLHEEKLQELFDEDDLLFFKFVLVEKAGYNLRNKIAHSLIKFREYQITHIHLLILILLKIGQFDFKKTSNRSSASVKDNEKE